MQKFTFSSTEWRLRTPGCSGKWGYSKYEWRQTCGRAARRDATLVTCKFTS